MKEDLLKFTPIGFVFLGIGVLLPLLANRIEPWVIVLWPLGIISIYLFIRCPDITFALFLTAGVYKADLRLSFLPQFLDLTILFGGLTIIGVAYGVMIKQIRFITPSKQILMPYFLITLLGIFSLSYTPAPLYGTDKLLRFMTITSLALFLPFFLFQSKVSITRFFTILIVLAILMIGDTVSSGLTPEGLAFHTAFGSSYLAIGRIVGTSLIIVLFYFVALSKNIFRKTLYFFLIFLMLFGIFISGGRGPLLSLGVSILAIFIYLLIMFLKRMSAFSMSIPKDDFRTLSLIGVTIIMIVALIINFHEYFSTIFMRLELLQAGAGSSVSERVYRWKGAIETMLTFPKGLIGLGIGGFSVFYEGLDDKRGAYPHNIFLEFGSELGLLGLIAITLLILWSFSTVISTIKETQSNEKFLNITFLALLVFMVGNSSVSGDINDNRLLFTWIGLIHAYKQVTKNSLIQGIL